MENPETLATLGAQDTGQKNSTQKTKRMSDTSITNQNGGCEPGCSRRV